MPRRGSPVAIGVLRVAPRVVAHLSPLVSRSAAGRHMRSDDHREALYLSAAAVRWHHWTLPPPPPAEPDWECTVVALWSASLASPHAHAARQSRFPSDLPATNPTRRE